MTTTEDHLQWAQDHFTASERIGRSALYSWQAISLFYCALQLAHAALIALPDLSIPQARPGTHEGSEGTNRMVQRYAPADVSAAYLALFSASVDARYNGRQVSAPEIEHFRYHYMPLIARWACDVVHASPTCECWIRAKV